MEGDMMGVVVSVTNQKGGVGKTVTVSSLASALTRQGYKVLSINLDPQRNLDMVAGKGIAIPLGDKTTRSMLDVLRRDCSLEDVIIPCDFGDLARASNLLSQWTGRSLISRTEFESLEKDEVYKLIEERYSSGWGTDDHKVLKEIISSVRERYDYIFMDTNPSLTLLTINSLVAADYVLIPAFAEAASRDAITELWDTIRGLRAYNPDMQLQVAGILITKFKPRNPFAKKYIQVYKRMAQSMGGILFEQKIREATTVTEYITTQENLLSYDSYGNAALDYKKFADEFTARIAVLERMKSHG